jgi:hypothetical protein
MVIVPLVRSVIRIRSRERAISFSPRSDLLPAGHGGALPHRRRMSADAVPAPVSRRRRGEGAKPIVMVVILFGSRFTIA